MVVKNQIKFVKSLRQKKYRNQHGLFVVEGIKTVSEFLNSAYKAEMIYTTAPGLFKNDVHKIEQVTEKEMLQMSGLHSPSKALGIFYIPSIKELDFEDWILAVDEVRDPGNLGTIIRLCDWFGIKHIVCSEQTVDCYNPKVLQATMGSLTRVQLRYGRLAELIGQKKVDSYGTFMDGSPVYSEKFPSRGILVMGNEANGIGAEIAAMLDHKISIPHYGNRTTESLNVATATAVLLSEFRRS